MPQILSHAHIELEIGGHTFLGYADEDRPVEFDGGADRISTSVGKDGGLYGVDEAMLGGDITIRLAPTSPSAQWCITENQMRKDTVMAGGDATPIYDGSYNDNSQGRAAELLGGVLVACPDMVEPGVTFEVMFRFEQIISSVDGATFTAPRDERGVGLTDE